MAFVNTSLLLGGLLIAVPVVLHLIMRRQPRRLVFPAMRFVKAKRDANRRRLRLRHLLLLALRCAAIGLLAMALARPSLKGSGVLGKEGAPIAAALVVDNSLRMEYRHENATRLEVAQELAAGLLQHLPEDTRAAVGDVGGGRPAFAVDLGAARERIARLMPSAASARLADVTCDAIRLLAEQEDYRQEVFVFTDLAAVAWSDDDLAAIADCLEASADVAIYFVDVGVPDAINFGLGPIRFSDAVLSRDTPVTLRVPLRRAGPDVKRLVELYVRQAGEQEQNRGQQIGAWSAAEPGEVEFSLSGLEYGTHQGSVRVVGEDALAADDVRYFTLDVRPPRRVLLLSESENAALFVDSALATTGRFESRVEKFDRATGADVEDISAIFLLDPPPLATPVWTKLGQFVEEGGGAAICLGHNARRNALNDDAPQRLLAGTLQTQSRFATYFSPTTFDHPILAKFRQHAGQTPWQQFPVEKFWKLGALASETDVVARFANGRPAIVERQIGAGRTLTVTTPFSDPAFLPDREVWNLLPTGLGSQPWPFLVLVNEMAAYLSGGGDDRTNYLAGETASLHLGPEERRAVHAAGGLAVLPPVGDGMRRSLAPGQDVVTVSATGSLGNYRVTAGGRAGALKRGFSVNASPAVSAVARTETDRIAKALGKKRVRFARNADEIEVNVGLGRVGRELYAWLIGLVAIAFAAELLLANRFYREDPT